MCKVYDAGTAAVTRLGAKIVTEEGNTILLYPPRAAAALPPGGPADSGRTVAGNEARERWWAESAVPETEAPAR